MKRRISSTYSLYPADGFNFWCPTCRKWFDISEWPYDSCVGLHTWRNYRYVRTMRKALGLLASMGAGATLAVVRPPKNGSRKLITYTNEW